MSKKLVDPFYDGVLDFDRYLSDTGLPHEEITHLFTEEENRAIRGETEMRQELYDNILSKCIRGGQDMNKLFVQFMDSEKYGEFLARYRERLRKGMGYGVIRIKKQHNRQQKKNL